MNLGYKKEEMPFLGNKADCKQPCWVWVLLRVLLMLLVVRTLGLGQDKGL